MKFNYAYELSREKDRNIYGVKTIGILKNNHAYE